LQTEQKELALLAEEKERIEAQRQERLAIAAKNDAIAAEAKEREAKLLAEKRATALNKSNKILGSVFENLRPEEIALALEPLQVTLARNLNTAIEQLDAEAIGDPLIVAEIQDNLGHTLISLGDPKNAVKVLSKACETRKAKLGEGHPDTLTTINNLAGAYQDDGQVRKAIPLFEATLERRNTKLGEDHPDMLTSMNNLALAYYTDGQFRRAIPLFKTTLETRKAKQGENHPTRSKA